MAPLRLNEELERSADPSGARSGLERLFLARPALVTRLEDDRHLRNAVVAVVAASAHLTRLLVNDHSAVEVLADLDHRPDLDRFGADAAGLARWKHLELLRIAARDLTGMDRLEDVGAALSDLADDVVATACQLCAMPEGFAVIAMGKLGGRELNYASDIDVVLVGDGDPRLLLQVLRHSWRVDLNLRPEGRNGPLVRSLASYLSYWRRWADTWEFQALLKARPIGGDAALGQAFVSEASAALWTRPFAAEDLRAVRAMKTRTEEVVARRGLADREVKLGRGGIRDVEFAVQLLQLVHGRADPALRSASTLQALEALSEGGYVAPSDAATLDEAYRFLRAVEHRLQLVEDQQVHSIPTEVSTRMHLARVMGYRNGPSASALEQFDLDRRRHQVSVRSIHERLFFRPLLEAFARGSATDQGLRTGALRDRLAAFGFSEANRTRQAVLELTRGFTRSSRMMQQFLPLVFEWLSQAPDPDLGLLGLQALVAGAHQREQLTGVFRESPEAARQLCLLLGTGTIFIRGFERHPDLLGGLADGVTLRRRTKAELANSIELSLAWRHGFVERRKGLAQVQRSSTVQIAVRDVVGLADAGETALASTNLADTVMSAALSMIGPSVPLAVIAMGSFGGSELSYASDLDVMFVYEAGTTSASAVEAERTVELLLRLVNGSTPAARIYTLDPTLRPEGRQGPLARSLDAFELYYRRWAKTWERQALLRARFVAGDAQVAARYLDIAAEYLWGSPFADAQITEIRRMKARMERERLPAGQDPQFHLKLGRGTLSDVEWTTQMLQLRHQVAGQGTLVALAALVDAGVLDRSDAAAMTDAYRYCEMVRNRLFLLTGTGSESLPVAGPLLTQLSRSLGSGPSELRETYRRLTRRSREVMERLFYA